MSLNAIQVLLAIAAFAAIICAFLLFMASLDHRYESGDLASWTFGISLIIVVLCLAACVSLRILGYHPPAVWYEPEPCPSQPEASK